MNLKVKIDNGYFPERAHYTDAGHDIRSAEDCIILPHETRMVHAGIRIEIPHGYYGDMKSRSSLFKRGILVDGTIDCSYRGEVMVIIKNMSDDQFNIYAGDKIAQMVITPCAYCEVVEVEELSQTERGEGGFGSTGR